VPCWTDIFTLETSASHDQTLKLWDAESGRELGPLPFLGSLLCIATHPWLPRAVCGDSAGGVHLIDLEGIEYGPVIVTALERDGALTVRCPACFKQHPLLELAQLDEVTTCPRPGCETKLKVNPFVLESPR